MPAESVLIEYGFLDSSRDDQNQIKNDWQKWAEAVVEAITTYKGYNYFEPNDNTVNNVYKVQKGDSLWSISKKFNVGISELKMINNLNNNLITVGQELVIPGFAPPSQTNTTYVVQKGDSLWSIANANNTTVDEIANLNQLQSNTLYIGQILELPNISDVIINTKKDEYIVQKGDTLYSIALKYNTTPEAIIKKNNLKSNMLYIGQIIEIPSDVESSGDDSDAIYDNEYIVKSGDSLYLISKMYNISVDDLKKYNNLNNNILSVGQIIKIPTNLSSGYEDDINEKMYIVQKGDTLWKISEKYNISVNDLRLINNLKSDILTIGQILIIP